MLIRFKEKSLETYLEPRKTPVMDLFQKQETFKCGGLAFLKEVFQNTLFKNGMREGSNTAWLFVFKIKQEMRVVPPN